MMITKSITFGVKCDLCGGAMPAEFPTEGLAEKAWKASGMCQLGEAHFCTDCDRIKRYEVSNDTPGKTKLSQLWGDLEAIAERAWMWLSVRPTRQDCDGLIEEIAEIATGASGLRHQSKIGES